MKLDIDNAEEIVTQPITEFEESFTLVQLNNRINYLSKLKEDAIVIYNGIVKRIAEINQSNLTDEQKTELNELTSKLVDIKSPDGFISSEEFGIDENEELSRLSALKDIFNHNINGSWRFWKLSYYEYVFINYENSESFAISWGIKNANLKPTSLMHWPLSYVDWDKAVAELLYNYIRDLPFGNAKFFVVPQSVLHKGKLYNQDESSYE